MHSKMNFSALTFSEILVSGTRYGVLPCNQRLQCGFPIDRVLRDRRGQGAADYLADREGQNYRENPEGNKGLDNARRSSVETWFSCTETENHYRPLQLRAKTEH